MKKCDCLLCSFENPKASATGVIIKDQKILVMRRKDAPFKGKWDLPGGYVNKNESIEQCLIRELKEELGVNSELNYINCFTGTASYKDYVFPIINFTYLVNLTGKIKLDTKENSAYAWKPLKSLKTIAFDSNQKILKHLQKHFVFDLSKVKSLIKQLDSSAVFNEQSLYKAMLTGHVSQVKDNGKLIGMGWIFPRQTLLRRQAVVEDMIVDEKYRGKGLGEKILKDLLLWAKNQGVEVVELTTNPKRVAANSLYQKVGFQLHPTNHYLLKL